MDPLSDRGQHVVALLRILCDLGGIRTKQEVLREIQASHLLDLISTDWQPFETQSEPRWHTIIAYARKDCVEAELMFRDDERDSWALTRAGISKIHAITSAFNAGTHNCDVRRCYRWSETFKRRMCPTYVPSDMDAQRPPGPATFDLFL